MEPEEALPSIYLQPADADEANAIMPTMVKVIVRIFTAVSPLIRLSAFTLKNRIANSPRATQARQGIGDSGFRRDALVSGS
jgi:hypothetical protein